VSGSVVEFLELQECLIACWLVEEEEEGYHGLCLVRFESSKLVCLQLWRERESKGRGWVKSPSRKVSWTKKLLVL
jgi:hypothetical protein